VIFGFLHTRWSLTKGLRFRLGLFLVTSFPMSVWLLTFYPGTFTNDSLSIIAEIRSGSWSNSHTNAYVWFVWFFSGGGSAWGFVSVVQVLLLSLGISSVGYAFAATGIRRSVITLACGIFASLPQVSAFAITMWKDVPSSAGMLMLIASLVEQRAVSFQRSVSLLLLGFGALLLGAFRWNGPVALILLGVILFSIYRRQSWRVLGVLSLATVVSVISLLFPQQLGLAESRPWMAVDYRELHDIAYVYHEHPTSLTTADREVLMSIMPLEHWSDGGSTCETIDVLLYKHLLQFSSKSIDMVRVKQAELRAVWQRLARVEPLRLSWVRLCRAGGVWSPIFFGAQPTLGLV